MAASEFTDTGRRSQFQAYVPGLDVRVHVLDTQVLDTSVRSAATDWHFDRSDEVTMLPVTILDGVGEQCVRLVRRLGLELSGIDLRCTDDGRIVCFEVDQSPAYIVQEDVTGRPIDAPPACHVQAR
ncbi:hypothetical protein [Nocardia sp. NPDC051463]|uniref:hypothetical protein n=1 Tax=Nocardia sp. NPDC051463 TaxID=3154845 RepID=UPI00344D3A56